MDKLAKSSELIRRIAPTKKPDLVADRLGHVKIRLSYLTVGPKHIRNAMLHTQGIPPPYIEDICILMPQVKVFNLIESFMPAFAVLQDSGLIPKAANIQSFKVLDEDTCTLAYTF